MMNETATVIITAVFAIAVVFMTVRDIIVHKGSNVAKVLSKLLDGAVSDAFTKVAVTPEEYDIMITALSSKKVDTSSCVVINRVIRDIIRANYDSPTCQSLSVALANTIVELTPSGVLAEAYTRNADTVIALIHTFSEVNSEGDEGTE